MRFIIQFDSKMMHQLIGRTDKLLSPPLVELNWWRQYVSIYRRRKGNWFSVEKLMRVWEEEARPDRTLPINVEILI